MRRIGHFHSTAYAYNAWDEGRMGISSSPSRDPSIPFAKQRTLSINLGTCIEVTETEGGSRCFAGEDRRDNGERSTISPCFVLLALASPSKIETLMDVYARNVPAERERERESENSYVYNFWNNFYRIKWIRIFFFFFLLKIQYR